MLNPFDSLNNLLKGEKAPEKRMIRHAQEREIIDIALNNLSLSEKGQELVDFVQNNDVKISVLRGKESRDYTPDGHSVFISVSDDTDINDPVHTIHMIAAIREAMQEQDPMLKTPSISQGESVFVHRMGQKDDDKLIWQGIIVYELGKIANKSEFIDTFTLMGYYSLVEAYEKDLTDN